MLEAFCARVLRLGAERPAADRRAARRRRPLRARGVPLRAARLARRGARRRSAARSGGCRSSPTQNAQHALESDRLAGASRSGAAGRGARGAARGAEPRVPADPDRVLRHLEHPGPSRRSARWSSSRTRVPKKAHYRKFGVRDGSSGPDDFAAMAEVISRRFARLSRRRRATELRRVVRGGAEPRRDRRRQGPALRGARGDAGVRPAARRGDRAREARSRRCSSPAARPDRARRATRRACSSCSGSATRRTASRSASTASAARRAARASIFDDLQGVGPARRRALLRHFGSAERLLEASPGGARGRARASRRRRRARSTRSCTRQVGG